MEAKLKDALEAKRAYFDRHLETAFVDVQPEELREAVAWYPEAGGKRLRPSMALLACEATGGATSDAIPVALAVELVHNFSLVHDDIMDRDDTRRGRPTVHKKWSEPTAILAGDTLFALAFEALARIPDAVAHREAAKDLALVVRRLCEGQMRDIAFERRNEVSLEEYMAMIRGKTALLFEAATRGGALAGHATAEQTQALARYGESFGLAFQIADDLLDITSDSETMGKPWGSDVRAGKQTLLVVEAYRRAGPKEREVLDDILGDLDASDLDVRRAVDVFEATGALNEAKRVAEEQASIADAALDTLPENEARETLRRLNRWALHRTS